MGDLPASVALKLARAQEHRCALRDALTEWARGEPEPYRFVVEEDPDSDGNFQRHRCVVHIIRPLPTDLLTGAFGDFLHNARSVLDHLVWELSVLNEGDPPSQPTVIGFPAYDRPPAAGKSLRGLHAVHVNVAAAVKELQPYHAGKDARSHPLWMLCQLSNRDKHRTVHPVYHYAREAGWTTEPVVVGMYAESVTGVLVDGAIVSRLHIPRLIYRDPVEMKVRYRTFHGIAIPPTPKTPLAVLGPMVDAICEETEKAADRLRHFFP